MSILLGAIADDFTGATDLASTLVKRGMRVVQTIGVPRTDLDFGDAEAMVVALKSRTAPVEHAVESSRRALEWLQQQGARQVVFKYCSTFDSTPEGNIGPVADALMGALPADLALICPAFPANGRTVYQGYLFVGDRLLSESSMKDHPLTPMHDANLVRLMAAQSRHRVGLVPLATVAAGASAVEAACDGLRARGIAYAVADALTDEHLETIGRAAAGHRLITGGSGVAMALPVNFRREGLLSAPAVPELPEVAGGAAVLAGSCSRATRAQIECVSALWPNVKLDADRLAEGESVVDEVLAWALEQDEDLPILIFSSANPEEVAEIQDRYGREYAGAMIEDAFGRIAQGLVEAGTRRMIVAGGETAGAVVTALGIDALRIGLEIDPGVPWTESLGGPRLALALKSGNFGAADFFAKALGMLA